VPKYADNQYDLVVFLENTLTHYPDSKQSSLFAPILPNAACLAEKLQISIFQSLI
jgi:hypothetical protein